MRTLNSFRWWLAALLAVSAFEAGAQTYDISWYKIAGGGGTSTSSVYTVTGTIGQPDAGNLAGGQYSITGGFWGIIATVQTPGSPLLSIASVTNNVVMLSWPAAFPGFHLQQNTSANATNWVNVNTNSFPVGITNGFNSAALPVSGGNQFFRLISP